MPRRECVLYITDDCTMCDEALRMLLESTALRGVIVATVDVATDDELFRRFGEHIPVLEYIGNTLVWPFSAEEAQQLLSTS